MTAVVPLIIIILIVLFITLLIVLIKISSKNKNADLSVKIENFIESNAFILGEVYTINDKLAIALNEKGNRFAIVKNFSPKDTTNAIFVDFPVSNLIRMQMLKSVIELTYIKDSETTVLKIENANKAVKKFLYKVFKKVNFAVIQKRYPEVKFDAVSSSDWQSTYIWAFSSKSGVFVYYDIENQFVSHKINLLKTNLALDIRYSYFEMSIYNIKQQLVAYETEFYDSLFNALLKIINEKYACILKNSLYYDNNNNVVFLSNGTNSLQIINIDTVDEVYYGNNKLSFKISQSDKMINYNASKELVNQFEDFVINLNLKQIAQNFNYSSGKVINTSDNTKVIIDYIRSRIVYCANLNSLSTFSYCIMSFDTIRDVEYCKSGQNIFVRVYINKKDIIDISCTKKEVAYYILAQIRIIINEQSQEG